MATGTDRLVRLMMSPGARELNGIIESFHRLRRRLARFRAEHGPACRCVCCAHLRRQADAFEELAAAETVVLAFADLLSCSRPLSRRDLRRLPGA